MNLNGLIGVFVSSVPFTSTANSINTPWAEGVSLVASLVFFISGAILAYIICRSTISKAVHYLQLHREDRAVN
jgi:hypothetical protein